LVIPALFAYCLGRFYFFAYEADYFTVARFAYLLLACMLIQIFRDGLISLVIFPVVNMMPLTAIILLHYVAPLLIGNASSSGASPASKTFPRQARA
ncbi:MAG: hypothetical protein ACXW18_01165, partial [Pyrinomonadaceae bacterium]